jgi:hypothetical protein
VHWTAQENTNTLWYGKRTVRETARDNNFRFESYASLGNKPAKRRESISQLQSGFVLFALTAYIW